MNTKRASLGRSTVHPYSSTAKRAFDAVLFSMECTARWLENACDPMQAAAEIRLAMAELRNCIADCELVAEVRKHAVPAGWKLVPVEPTPEMEDAAYEDAYRGIGEWARSEGAEPRKDWTYTDAYAAMLAAAPTLPAQPCGEGDADEAVTKDAERYRFLAASAFKHLLPTAETIDAAIAKERK